MVVLGPGNVGDEVDREVVRVTAVAWVEVELVDRYCSRSGPSPLPTYYHLFETPGLRAPREGLCAKMATAMVLLSPTSALLSWPLM